MKSKKNNQIVKWATDRVKTKFADDVSLLVCYGSYINGTANSLSDVDLYYIPKTVRAKELMQTFMIEGVGYDLFPISWERVEGFADFVESLTPLLGNVKILFSASSEEIARFEALQKRLIRNLHDDGFMQKRAHERLCSAYQALVKVGQCSQVEIGKARLFAGRMLMALAEAVAYHNNCYFERGLKTQYQDIEKMESKPENFLRLYRAIIEAKDTEKIALLCRELMEQTADYLGCTSTAKIERAEQKPQANEPSDDFNALAEYYQEIVSTFNKITVCCEENNTVLAYLSAVCLQGDLNEISELYGFQYFDLLSVFDSTAHSKLKEKAKEIEQKLLQRIRQGGASLRSFASFKEFEESMAVIR